MEVSILPYLSISGSNYSSSCLSISGSTRTYIASYIQYNYTCTSTNITKVRKYAIYDKQNIQYVGPSPRFRYLNIFQLAEKTASQGWTPALAPRRGTAPRSWRARGDKMEGREVIRAFHWMLWKFKRRGFRERESADAIARFRAPFRRERVKKYSNRRNIYCARCVWEAVTNVIKIFKYRNLLTLCFVRHIIPSKVQYFIYFVRKLFRFESDDVVRVHVLRTKSGT